MTEQRQQRSRSQTPRRSTQQRSTRGRKEAGGGRNGRGGAINASTRRPARRRSTSPKVTRTRTAHNKSQLRIIPLGGLEEVGKNMTAFEFGNDIIIVDLGLMFPSEDMPGIDYVVPDYHYLQKNKNRVKALIITHGHLDHIGAIPYLINRIGNPPIYATPLTAGIIQQKLEEFNLQKSVMLNVFKPDDTFSFGEFGLSFFRVNHNIPDGVGIALKTPIGTVVHTGDFKIDFTPRDEQPAELHKIAKLGGEGVLLLMSDSTNAEQPGSTTSEKEIGKNLEKLIGEADGRVIVSTFATLVSRIQQVFDAAEKTGKKVAVSGYSLDKALEIAYNLGALKFDKKRYIRLKDIGKLKDEEVIIISTGSQGQENSALGRMAKGEHRQVKLKQGDTIILSSSPIPGNERAIQNLMNSLFQLGTKVIYNKMFDIHTSGHGYQNDLRLMLALAKPKFFMPIHGERHMLEAHARLAEEVGIARSNIFILSNGNILELEKKSGSSVVAGMISKTKLPNSPVMVDGLGVGDIGEVVLRDRQVMAQDGMFVTIITIDSTTHKVIGDPEIISRGFMYMKGNDQLIKDTITKIKDICNKHTNKKIENWSPLRASLRDDIGSYLFQKTERRPMILPVIIEI